MNFAVGPCAPGDELFDAARRDDTDLIKKILKPPSKKRVDSVDSDGRTALWWASLQGNISSVRLLLDSGADVFAEDITGSSPCNVASQYGQLEVLKEFLEREKRSEESPPAPKRAKTKRDSKTRLVEYVNSQGWTLLHFASRFGQKDVCSWLISNGSNVDGEPATEEIWTPLLMAVEVKQKNCVKVLLDKGANPNLLRGVDPVCAIHVACRVKNLEFVKLLLEGGADQNVKSAENGGTALHYAAESGSPQIIELLIAKDPSSLNVADTFGRLPIHVACSFGRETGLAAIMQHCDKELLSIFSNGEQTPLYLAISSRSIKCVQALVEAGADVCQKCSHGTTPLHIAALFNNANAIEYLLKNGAEKTINIKDDLGRTPLEAASHSRAKKAEAVLKKAK